MPEGEQQSLAPDLQRPALRRAELAQTQRSVRNRLSAFLELIKPYREIAAIAVAAVVGISTFVSWGVSWAVTHFATKLDLSTLNCHINNDLWFNFTIQIYTPLNSIGDNPNYSN
jgi:hypothetical protein